MEELDLSEAVGAAEDVHTGPSRDVLMKVYDAEEADALLSLEQQLTGIEPQEPAEDVTAAGDVYRSGS
ncbi:hypothetical protein ACFFK0_26510 [Paenibacillus chartarius]|uniref:Uncharacterized protein n=1 Tax=Paenibacillus chartarius TaxID=747481 RepID=A0ABV6DTG3_9BACL